MISDLSLLLNFRLEVGSPLDPHAALSNKHTLLGPQPWSLCLRRETVYNLLAVNDLFWKKNKENMNIPWENSVWQNLYLIVCKLKSFSYYRRCSFKCPLVHLNIIRFKENNQGSISSGYIYCVKWEEQMFLRRGSSRMCLRLKTKEVLDWFLRGGDISLPSEVTNKQPKRWTSPAFCIQSTFPIFKNLCVSSKYAKWRVSN